MRLDDVNHELLVTVVIVRDVEVTAILGHVDFVAARTDEETSRSSRDILTRNPYRGHLPRAACVEIVGILMRPSGRVALKVHTLNDFPRLPQKGICYFGHRRCGQDLYAGLAKSSIAGGINALDIQYGIQDVASR